MTSTTPQSGTGGRRLFASLLALLSAGAVSAQQTSPSTVSTQTDEKKIPVETTPATAPAAEEEVVMLSPFTVDASKDIGYYAENTLAGSRINTKLGDLASSVTVVTKQQLLDTASTDINDVFMYESNTEGANTYTQTDVSRNGVPRDTIAGYSSDQGVPSTRANANRVRGLAAPDSAINNYPSISRVPFDAYNTNSLEISRGPNSLLFGTGSPAGIVNQSTSQAVFNKRLTSVELRYGSWDAKRFALSHNQPIIQDKLSIYIAGLHDSKGFRRKPSDDIQRRQYIAVSYKPFQKTLITASFEHYDEFNHSPNSQTPRDYVTPWLRAGRPAYDPVARTITFLDTGVVKGPYVTDTRSPGYTTGMVLGNTAITQAPTASVANPLYIREGISFGLGGSNRIAQFVHRNTILGVNPVQGAQFTTRTPAPSYSLDYVRPDATAMTSAQWAIADRRLTSSTGFIAPTVPAAQGGGNYGTWITPSITDRSIYDWTSINALDMNYGYLDMRTWNVELQQEILPSLHFSAGWFRQILDTQEAYTMSNANAITTIYVDTNLKNMDGSTNPFFGSPFMMDIAPDTFKNPELNDNYRAILNYDLDLTKQSSFLRFLGKHRMVGLWSRQDDQTHSFRYRQAVDTADARYTALPTAANAVIANANYSRVFYVGQNQNGHVDYSSGLLRNASYGGPDTATASTYNWATGNWDKSQLHYSSLLFYAGNYGYNQKVIDGKSVALSSYFWDDRIIFTAGWREDDYKARATNTTGLTTTNSGLSTDLYTNGLAINPEWADRRLKDWYKLSGQTQTTGLVAHVFRWRDHQISLFANRSDNFNPPSGLPVDFYGTALPKSTGEGKDYGVAVSMFDNKLVARVNWYDSTNENAATTAAATAISRVGTGDTSNFRNWAEYVVRFKTNQAGEANTIIDPTTGVPKLTDTQFANNSASGHGLTQTMKDEIAKLMGVPSIDSWPPTGISGTQTNKSKGIEFSLIYNPMRNWNIKATASKVHATYDNVAPEIDAWLFGGTGNRLAYWKAATASLPEYDYNDNGVIRKVNFLTQGGTPVRLSDFWSGFGYNSNVRLSNSTSANPSWVSTQGYYESAILSEINVAKALQGKTVPNERQWSFNVITNYAFESGWRKGFTVGGGVRWADRAIAGFYGNTAKSARDSLGNVVAYDLSRPIYTPSQINYDFWVGYTRKIYKDKVGLKIQLNVRDAMENGHLEPVAYNLDGSAFAYRIIDPRQFFLTTTFTF